MASSTSSNGGAGNIPTVPGNTQRPGNETYNPNNVSFLERQYLSFDDLVQAVAKNPDFAQVISQVGVAPRSPDDIKAEFLEKINLLSPGITADLPGVLLEDISGTAVGALAEMDSAKADLYGSVSPLTVNPQFLNLMGQTFGIIRGTPTNASAYLTLEGTPTLSLPQGFLFSDGNHLWQLQESVVLSTSGLYAGAYVVATDYFDTVIPAGAINQIASGILSGQTLTCTNSAPATLATGQETDASYRQRIWDSWRATSNATSKIIKKNLEDVPGVIQRTVSVRFGAISEDRGLDQIQVLCDGGDPLQEANAIFNSIFNPAVLVNSTVYVTGVSFQEGQCLVTTNINSGVNGELILSGVVGIPEVNGTWQNAVLVDSKRIAFPWVKRPQSLVNAQGEISVPMKVGDKTGTFAINENQFFSTTDWTSVQFADVAIDKLTGITNVVTKDGKTATFDCDPAPDSVAVGISVSFNATSMTTGAIPTETYKQGGVIANNARNLEYSIIDGADTYDIKFIRPLQQQVRIEINWESTAQNTVDPTVVQNVVAPNIISYVNSIPVGNPLNAGQLERAFLDGFSSVQDPSILTSFELIVYFDGEIQSNEAPSTIYPGDPESYFVCQNGDVQISRQSSNDFVVGENMEPNGGNGPNSPNGGTNPGAGDNPGGSGGAGNGQTQLIGIAYNDGTASWLNSGQTQTLSVKTAPFGGSGKYTLTAFANSDAIDNIVASETGLSFNMNSKSALLNDAFTAEFTVMTNDGIGSVNTKCQKQSD